MMRAMILFDDDYFAFAIQMNVSAWRCSYFHIIEFILPGMLRAISASMARTN